MSTWPDWLIAICHSKFGYRFISGTGCTKHCKFFSLPVILVSSMKDACTYCQKNNNKQTTTTTKNQGCRRHYAVKVIFTVGHFTTVLLADIVPWVSLWNVFVWTFHCRAFYCRHCTDVIYCLQHFTVAILYCHSDTSVVLHWQPWRTMLMQKCRSSAKNPKL